MNRKRAISLTITAISVLVSVIILIQLLPYINLRNCKVSQELGFNGLSITVINPSDHPAKFPRMTFNLYRGSVFLGNGTIQEFEVPAHSNITQRVPFDLAVNLSNMSTVLVSNTTIVNGSVYLPILTFNVPIKYKVVNNGVNSVLYVLGRKIVVG